jgi:hypothetical protein
METSTAKSDAAFMASPKQESSCRNYYKICLLAAGCSQSKLTPGYWKHGWHPISFTLVMDDFNIKYIGKEHPMHLIKTLKEYYKVEEDWEGKRYLEIAMDWDYKNREVHMSMPDYVKCALAQFRHPIPTTPQHQPHQHAIPTYRATVQYAKPDNTLKCLSPAKKISPRSDWCFPLLRMLHGSQYAHITKHNCIRPSRTYGGYHIVLYAVPGILSYTPRCHNNLQEK